MSTAPLLVQKFGGTSLADVERIRVAAELVHTHQRRGERVVVVTSAMGDATDLLLGLAHSLAEEPSERELDALLATGEQVSSALLGIALNARGCPARAYNGGQAGILTDGRYNRARIRNVDTRPIRQALGEGCVVVVTGFQGMDTENNINTLGRGGSDTTAVALAAALEARECQIYTDVAGVYTADPRLVPGARLLSCLSVEEMLELASLGSQVLELRAVEFAGRYRVPLRVLSSLESGDGTLVMREEDMDQEKMAEAPAVTGVAYSRDEAKLTVCGIPDRPGAAYRVLEPISAAAVNVDVIVQNEAHDGTNDLTFTVRRQDLVRARRALEAVLPELGAREVLSDTKVAKVSLVGMGMRSHSGVATRMFATLADASVNIQLITSSEIKISVIIGEEHVEQAVRVLHEAFALQEPPVEEDRSGSGSGSDSPGVSAVLPGRRRGLAPKA